MTICPGCGSEQPAHDSSCPAIKKPVKKPFTIRAFLWENFRLFTMVGVTGTMISLIPNTGTRVLGMSWITGPDSILPFFLSVIIFFGTVFLSICFLLIFSLILEGREGEEIRARFPAGSRPLITFYEGDLQRTILLLCLVPMWFGLAMFFLLLMPLIPNRYSWLFAAVIGLTLLPLVLYSFLGWNVGRTLISKIPVLRTFPRFSLAAITILVVCLFVAIPFVLPGFFDNTRDFSGDVRIVADQQYFAPQISTAKGLRLELTNLSGREVLASRQVWSADYGSFIQVIPSTSEVTILGNPAEVDASRYIYWTYPASDPSRPDKPVTIRAQVVPLKGDTGPAGASLTLSWYTKDIVRVNTSSGSRT